MMSYSDFETIFFYSLLDGSYCAGCVFSAPHKPHHLQSVLTLWTKLSMEINTDVLTATGLPASQFAGICLCADLKVFMH